MDRREEIARAIEAADAAFGFNMQLTRLVDGEHTYTFRIAGHDPFEVNDLDEGYAIVTARKNDARADALLALASPAALETGENAALREALMAARDQLWLLAKDPENNPWIKLCDAALSRSSDAGERA